MEEKKGGAGATDVIPLRPGFGTSGRRIKISANLFQLTISPRTEVFLYAIVYPEKPEIDKRDYPSVVRGLIADNQDDFKEVPMVHDDARMIFTALPLGFVEKEFVVRYQREEIAITIKSASSVSFGSLVEYAKGKAAETPRDAIQALEVILGSFPRTTLTTAGRGYFDGKNCFDIADGAEVWLGYKQASKIGQDRIYLNVDMANSAFKKPVPILEFIADFMRERDPNEMMARFRGQIPFADLDKVGRKLKGVKVEAGYMGGKRTWRVNGFSRLSARQHKFSPGGDDDAKEVTVENYFLTKFKIRLQYPLLALLHVGPPKKGIMIPVELCSIARGQRIQKLNPRQTADMIKLAAKTPSDRLNWIKKAEKVIRDPDVKNSVMSQFGISIGKELAVVDGRILDAPRLQYNEESKQSQVTPRGGEWRSEGKFYTPCTIQSWGVLSFERDRFAPKADLEKIARAFSSGGRNLGMTFADRPPIRYGDSRSEQSIQKSIDDVLADVKKAYKSDAQLLLVVLPKGASSALYGEIKRYSETEVDVVTQCVAIDKAKKCHPAYVGNVLLKINVKVGGINWVIPRNSIGFFMNKPAIIFGADVTHAGPGSPMPSIAAVVASMDAFASKFACVLRSQGRRLEIIEELSTIARDLLVRFYKNTRRKPERIMFYRDGVSEGQFQEVLSAEVKALRDACESLEENYRPTITFIVVQKRHNVRFFPNDPRDADKSGNVPAGLVVDRGITHPTQFDFYLNSHKGLQGTSRPCHYHVLADENGFSADSLQEFTYKLCYSYVRCTKSVSLVPAVYYAHLGAARARYHAKGDLYHSDDVSVASGKSGKSGEIVVEFGSVKNRTNSVMYFV